jgi:hypothetical protein
VYQLGALPIAMSCSAATTVAYVTVLSIRLSAHERSDGSSMSGHYFPSGSVDLITSDSMPI